MDNGGPSQRQPITQAPLPSFLTVLVVVLEMRSSYFATIHIIALLGFSLLARASVIFPQNIHHHHSNRRRNQLKRKGQSSLLNKRNNLIDFRSLRRTPSAHPPEFRNGEYGMIQSLTSLSLGRTGGLVLVGSTAIHLINKLRSEAFKRAIYFWYHAGPIVVHYKFTQWFLTKTKAPLESELQNLDVYCVSYKLLALLVRSNMITLCIIFCRTSPSLRFLAQSVLRKILWCCS